MILMQFSSLQINLILINSLDAEGDVLVKSPGVPHVLCRLRRASTKEPHNLEDWADMKRLGWKGDSAEGQRSTQ